MTSILEVYDLTTGESTVLAEFPGIIEAPAWMKDGNRIMYNAGGHIFIYSISEGKSTQLDTGICVNCNNDHVLSPDEKYLGVSCWPEPATGWGSYIYAVPMDGGTPRKITENTPSFLHGWSNDGKELCYCAFREDRKVDIYVIPAEGGEEKRLTDTVGYNDGPEYSPDDRHIWFNSTRDGLMQAFRMNRDGSDLQRMTHLDMNCWFPHISPDGKKVVFLTFRKGDLEPWQHLPEKQVQLWLMNPDGSDVRPIVSLFGGQGTINVNSWAPDSTRFAYIRYRKDDEA